MSVVVGENYRQNFDVYKPETIKQRVTSLQKGNAELQDQELKSLLSEFIYALEKGEVRAAERAQGEWKSNRWVKEGILSLFKHCENSRQGENRDSNDVLPTRSIENFVEKGARKTPGATMRAGNFVGEGCTVMSQAYVNIGVYLGDGSMVDSNVTVGSCAQIGKNCHIGANTLVGGVLEPVEDKPVVIEDGVSIGGGSKVTSGFEIGENVEVAENTLLTPRIDIYDLKKNEVIRGSVPSDRRVFQRYVQSSVSDHKLFEDTDLNAQKPIAVAMSKEKDEAEIEEELRM